MTIMLAAGRLDQRAILYSLTDGLRPAAIRRMRCTVVAKESAAPAMAAGLRTGARVSVWCRYSGKIESGQYLRIRDRLLHITSVRDPDAKRASLVLTCDEFIGQCAEYRTELGSKHCRVHLQHDAPYLDELGQVTDYRVRAEVLIFEVGRPQVDDLLFVGGVRYAITQYADHTDDGVVRGLWLERLD